MCALVDRNASRGNYAELPKVSGLTCASLNQKVDQIFKHKCDFERYIEGLRLAGVPEK